MDRLLTLEMFIAVASEGGFAAVARQNFCSQTNF